MRLTTFLLIQFIFSPVFVVLKSCTLCNLQTLLFVPFVTTTVEGKYLRDKNNGDGSADADIALPPYFSSETTGPITDERTSNSRVPNRVVFLSGPHKAASSSVQANMAIWTSEEKYILKNWAWPEPSFFRRKNSNDPKQLVHHAKAFAAIVKIVSKSNNLKTLSSENVGTLKGLDVTFEREELIEIYRREFAKAWLIGYDLIIASENMDQFGYDDCDLPGLDGPDDSGDLWLDAFMDLMPWRNPVQIQTISETEQGQSSKEVSLTNLEGNNDMVTVVVKYRAPRVDHLISSWHQCCMKTMTFTKFLIDDMKSPSNNNSPIRYIDSLGLVQRYLDHGLDVVLIDMGGAILNGLDVSDIIACEVLGSSARCPQGKDDGDSSDKGPIVKNVKKPKNKSDFDISQYKVELLEFAIQNYDCQHESMIKQTNPKLTLLYPDMLLKNLDNCKNILDEDRLKSKNELVDEIVRIGHLANEENVKDEEEDM